MTCMTIALMVLMLVAVGGLGWGISLEELEQSTSRLALYISGLIPGVAVLFAAMLHYRQKQFGL